MIGGFLMVTRECEHIQDVEVWNIGQQDEMCFQIDNPSPDSKVVSISIHSDKVSMQFIEITLKSSVKKQYYKTNIIIEWEGWKTLNLTISDFKRSNFEKTDALNTGISYIECSAADLMDPGLIISFKASECTFPNSCLKFKMPVWYNDMPLIAINEGECLLENFTSPRFWDVSDWIIHEDDNFPSDERGISKEWFYANLWIINKPGRRNSILAVKNFNKNIEDFQTIIINLSIDKKSLLSIYFNIDGVNRTMIDSLPGTEQGVEIRIPISGKMLNSISIQLETDNRFVKESSNFKIVSFFRWILLEKKGFDHKFANGVTGIPKIADPIRISRYEEPGTSQMPIGILFDRSDIEKLKEKVNSDAAKTVFENIISEVEYYIDFEPEKFVGTYAPVDMLSQGIERDNSPTSLRTIASIMVNGALAYIITGDLKYGLLARRALLTVINIEHWTGGFVNRIPEGIAGYRAPFVESHISEAAALCFDMIYNLLTKDEVKSIEDAFYNKAVPWIDSYLRLYENGYLLKSNQGAVYSMGFIFAALIARRSHPDIDNLLCRRIEWFFRMLSNYYHHDGSTSEGPSYWEYTTYCAILSLIAVARFMKKNVEEITPASFKASIDYMMHMRSLSNEKLRYLCLGDCIEKAEIAMAGPAYLFSAKYLQDKGALWIWKKYLNLKYERGSRFFGSEVGASYTALPLLTLLLLEDTDVHSPELPPFKIFEFSQRIFIRTGAEMGDTLLFFEGGAQTFEHTHLDKGQFIIEAYGEGLLIDPGVINYGNPNSILFKNTAYHNLASIKNKDQSYVDAENAVLIKKLENTDSFNYIHADLTNSYLQFEHYERHILFIRPDYFLVLDCIDSYEDGIEWNLHSKGHFLKQSEGIYDIEAKTAGMLMHLVSNCSFTEHFSSYYDEEGIVCNNMVVEPIYGTKKFRIAALMYPYSKDHQEKIPEIKHINANNEKFIFTIEDKLYRDIIEYNMVSKADKRNDDNVPTIAVYRKSGAGSEAGKDTLIFTA